MTTPPRSSPGGTRQLTMRDVARSAKVAVGTVSRVLNKHPSVGADTRDRVLEAVHRLGYEPDAIAQSMRLRSTRTVACATRDIAITGFGSFVKAAEALLREHGYTLLLTNSDEDRLREMALLRSFAQRRVDGVIMTVSEEQDEELLKALREMRAPVLLMDRDLPLDLDVVAIDHRGGVREATRHLLQLGHSRIALITGHARVRPAHDRIAGFADAFAEAGMPRGSAIVRSGGFSAEFGEAEATDLLASERPPTAIIAGGMAMLPGILRAIAVRGLKVPDDISVIAGGESDLAALAATPITAICWSNAEWGRQCVRLLLERIQGRYEGSARRVMLPTELIERASCRPLAQSDRRARAGASGLQDALR